MNRIVCQRAEGIKERLNQLIFVQNKVSELWEECSPYAGKMAPWVRVFAVQA